MRKSGILLFVILIVIGVFCVGCGKEEVIENRVIDSVKMEVNLNENSSVFCLNGNIEIINGVGSYILYFADENGERLKGYTPIGVSEKDRAYSLENTVVPPLARSIIAVRGQEKIIYDIPSDYLDLSGDVYVFGALSDVHYNRYSVSCEDDALIYFDLALDYFESIDADFVGIAGDISNAGEEDSLIKYGDAIKDRSFPVFTVTGNHDVNALANGLWNEYISSNIEDCEFGENGLDFVYAPAELEGDVFVFLNQIRWDYNSDSSMLITESQIQWLGKAFEENKDRQVYLFFHTFLCGPDGEKHTGVGNIMNYGGCTYTMPYTYGTKDESLFRDLLKKYKNVVFFSGHSHWMFEMEKYGKNANFSDFDGEYCTMVHVPSVTEPRYTGDYETYRWGRVGEYSQGWVIYDYGEITVLVPVDFINGTFYTEYLEIVG